MKKLIALALAAAAIIPAINAKTVTETRSIKAFEKIEASSAVNIKYVQGTPVSFKITGEEKDVANTRISQTGNKLKIWRTDKEQKNFGKNRTVTVTVTTPVIRDIDLSGACSFSAKSLSYSGDIDIEASGASQIDIANLNAQEVDIECSGASSIAVAKSSTKEIDLSLSGASKATISGNTGYLDLQGSGACSAELGRLSAVSGKVGLSGASTATTNIKQVRNSHTSGAASHKNR